MNEQSQLRIQALQMAIDYTKDDPEIDVMYWANAFYNFLTNTEQK
jgi:hypothetical protein